MSLPRVLLVFPILCLGLVGLGCADDGEGGPGARATTAAGTLRVTAHGAGVRSSDAVVHRTTWVRGPDYDAMEDNDLRGFLDGRFVYGWNQPTQVHSRLGRRGTRPRWGETELFRTLVRWDEISLPAGARVRDASLTLAVEKGPRRGLDVMLYAVRRDWNPGDGGEQRNNTSPPKPGESWWNAAREGSEPWGHPGVGFASDTHPDADTGAMVLAETHWTPGEDRLVFRSTALARLIEERATAGHPIGLLVKLSDALEDTPDTVLYLYTGNYGDFRNPARRPVLEASWEAPHALASLEQPIRLELGRSVVFDRLAAPGARFVAASFEPDESGEAPFVEVRGAREGDPPGPWRPVIHPQAVEWDWLEVRATAGHDPVALGDAFETRLRDTWVRTAPPEEQEVVFSFESPSGTETRVPATYEGDYTWSVRFVPDEIGRWRYRYRSRFVKLEDQSPYGRFDVVAAELPRVRSSLERLLARLRSEYPELDDSQVQPLAPTFWRLERAVHQLATPDELASPDGREIYALLTEIRQALSGRRVPEKARATPMRREY
ncbi:MAG: DUF5060 domain-containing protein [Myxococcota bacterium]|nr:DUF5060 domain-containing protein [Myxococcota bacterium]